MNKFRLFDVLKRQPKNEARWIVTSNGLIAFMGPWCIGSTLVWKAGGAGFNSRRLHRRNIADLLFSFKPLLLVPVGAFALWTDARLLAGLTVLLSRQPFMAAAAAAARELDHANRRFLRLFHGLVLLRRIPRSLYQ